MATNGSAAAIERARTVLDNAYPFLRAPQTLGDKNSAAQVEGYEQLFDIVILATAAASIGIGFAASAMYASAQLHHPLVAPGTGYYALTAAGIVAALAILVGTFPLLARITGPDVARNE